MIKQLIDEIKSLQERFNKSETETTDVNIELAEVTFSDGRIARYEGEELAVGVALSMITPEGEVLASEGDLELADNGTILTIGADGIVTAMTEVPEEKEELSLSKEDIVKIISEQVAEDIKAFDESQAAKFEAQTKEIVELRELSKNQLELLEKFAKQPLATPNNKPETSTQRPSYLDKFRK